MRIYIVTYNDTFVSVTSSYAEAQDEADHFVSVRSGRYRTDITIETKELLPDRGTVSNSLFHGFTRPAFSEPVSFNEDVGTPVRRKAKR